jgi:uncharacterized protein
VRVSDREPIPRRAARWVRTAAVMVPTWCAAVAMGAWHAYRFYHPPRTRPGRTPADKGLPMRHVRLTTTRDRVCLDAWVIPGTGPHTVIVCHGVGRTKSDVLDHARMLHRSGYHVLAYDMRNHGESGRDRRYGRMADRYTSDLHDVLRWTARNPVLGRGHLAVLGLSFSAWPAMYLLRQLDGRQCGSQLAAIICDSGPMYDIPAGLRHFSELRLLSLPDWLYQSAASRLYCLVFQVTCAHMLAITGWPPCSSGESTRLMFVAGAEDPVVSATQVMAVAQRFPVAQRWIAPNAMHMNAVRSDRAEYQRRITTFLAEALVSGEMEEIRVGNE